MHLMTVNSAALDLVKYDRDSSILGLMKDENGEPTGELREFAAIFPIMRRLGFDFGAMANTQRALERYGSLAIFAGVTTITDLLNDLPEAAIDMMLWYTAGDDCPIRLVPALNALGGVPEEIRDRAKILGNRSTDRLRLGAVKVMTDGSIQGFTAQLKPPGYHTGEGDPIWNIAPEQLEHLADVLHAGGVQMHIHTNGDLASEVAIDALEKAVARHPKWDHRHIIHHFQMADEVQIQRRRCQPVRQSSLLFWGSASRDHARTRARGADKPVWECASVRPPHCHSLGHAGDAAQSLVHCRMRRQPDDGKRPRSRRRRTDHGR
jgi:predicted amidohydrolase YtcJ